VTVGVIGLGNAGARHARNALALGHSVVAYEPRPVEVKGVSRVSSGADLIELRPDAVIVATPPGRHATDAMSCLAAGIPTLVEKPLAETYAIGLQLTKFALANKVRLGVGYQMRWHESLHAMRDRMQEECSVHSGITGVIANVDVMDKWPAATYSRDMALEFSHELDAAAWLFPRLQKVFAWEMDDQGAVLFLCTPERDNAVGVVLSANGARRRRGVELWDTVREWRWEFSTIENEAAYRTELELFLKGEPLSDGLMALRLIEAARRSAVSGEWEEA